MCLAIVSFCNTFAIILMGKIESWLLYFSLVIVDVLSLFLTTPLVDLQFVIVVLFFRVKDPRPYSKDV